MRFLGTFRRLVCVLVLWWSGTGPYVAAQAVERYILVLKDGRRIAVSGYESSGDRIFYERFDARVGIARSRVETILVVPENQDTPELEGAILGHVLKAHNLRFTFGDFLQEDYFTAEIEPRLTPEEQAAYVRKLLSLKQREILEVEDQRQIAEMKGDIVDLGALERKLIAALRDLGDGQRASAQLAERHRAGASRDALEANPSGPGQNETTATGEAAVAERPAAEASVEALMDPSTGLARLQHQREMLLLLIKKNYGAGEKTGGVLALQQARQDLRIVDLRIRYFEHLRGMPTTSAAPAPPIP